MADLSQAGNDGFLGETPVVDSADPLWEAGPVSAEDTSGNRPETFRLEQNYPNPFNPTTKIQFSLAQDSDIRLIVFDLLGREIQVLAEGRYEAGSYSATFDATNLDTGAYLYQLETATQRLSGNMLLIK